MKRYERAVLHGRIEQIRCWLRGQLEPKTRRELVKELEEKQKLWREVKDAPVEDD